MFRKLLFWLRYRSSTDAELREMLELSIKAGRRVTHDFGHALNAIEDRSIQKRYRDRQDMWLTIFYPTNGVKDYRSQLHHEIFSLEAEVNRLQELCRKHGINPEDPNSIPI